jgi:predicted transcriptional regulator
MNQTFKQITNKSKVVQQVANALNISTHTVSGYVYGHQKVSELTGQRIDNCIEIVLEEQQRAVKAIERRLKG